MPRYEIVAHVARHIDCATPEEAAHVVRGHLTSTTGGQVELLHLAVWREEVATNAASPLPPSLRRKLIDFFSALDRSAADAEEAFRGRVAAILSASTEHQAGGLGRSATPPSPAVDR